MKRILAWIMVLAAFSLACAGLSGGIAAGRTPGASAPGPGALPADSSLAEIYARVNPGVVAVFSYLPKEEGVALGSGFVVDAEGHILTNMHVIDGAETIEIDFPSGHIAEGTVIAADPDSDLAVLRTDAPAAELHPLVLGDSEQVAVGDTVLAVGNPFGYYNTLTRGIVSGKGRTGDTLRGSEDGGAFLLGDMIQTDAALNPGNSGGPLLNLRGEVIGVNRSIVSEAPAGGSPVNSGVGFAVSSNIVRRVLPDLIAKGRYAYPYLGLGGLSELHLDTIRALGLPYTSGVYILDVRPGGPADAAGLRAGTVPIEGYDSLKQGGDLLLAVNGRPLHNFPELIAYLVLNAVPDDTVRFTVFRDGRTVEISVKLGVRPAS
jgi:S1-C subfamily serine protease